MKSVHIIKLTIYFFTSSMKNNERGILLGNTLNKLYPVLHNRKQYIRTVMVSYAISCGLLSSPRKTISQVPLRGALFNATN